MTTNGTKRIPFTLGQSLWGVAAITVAAITVLLGAIYFAQLESENDRLSKEVAALKLEAELKQLENDLKAPMEAIVMSDVPWPEAEEVRRAELSKAGITRYPPFGEVYLRGAPDFDLPLKERKPGEADCDVSLLGTITGGSYEWFWHNRSPETCGRFTNELENDTPIGRHLRDHPDVFRDRFRPLLLRLVQSSSRRMRCAACEALIVAGDRTPAVLDVVRDFAHERKWDVRKGRTVEQRYSWETRKCLKLIQEYDLDIAVPDDADPGVAGADAGQG
ncbi:MAG TPA: hypothetical protein VMY42_18855 [Thermoguttaceae bacterium]|nr:hypothetical protein [Thermoguttaceae bacterium]